MIRKNLVLATIMSASLIALPALAQSGTYSGGSGTSSSTNGGGSGSMGGSMSGGSRGDTIGGPAARTSTYGGTGAAGGGPSFNTLDHGHKGYLTRSDVKSDPSIARHFSQCDTNGNGQLTRSEFQACEHRYGDK